MRVPIFVSKKEIRDLARQIGREFNPTRVIVFGSYAQGSPAEGSDVDLLVIMAHAGRNGERALEIVQCLRPRIPVDLLVRTPQEVEQRLAWNDCFLKEVTERGKCSMHPLTREWVEKAGGDPERADKGTVRKALAHCPTIPSKVREILGLAEEHA